jgi:hypothetical protein
MDDGEGLGAKFWAGTIGVILAGGIAALLLFLLIGRVWYAWGVLGALIFFGGLILLFGWIYDRRAAKSSSI